MNGQDRGHSIPVYSRQRSISTIGHYYHGHYWCYGGKGPLKGIPSSNWQLVSSSTNDLRMQSELFLGKFLPETFPKFSKAFQVFNAIPARLFEPRNDYSKTSPKWFQNVCKMFPQTIGAKISSQEHPERSPRCFERSENQRVWNSDSEWVWMSLKFRMVQMNWTRNLFYKSVWFVWQRRECFIISFGRIHAEGGKIRGRSLFVSRTVLMVSRERFVSHTRCVRVHDLVVPRW